MTEAGDAGQATGEVLFATIAAGGGHVATARALAEAVERQSQGRLRTRVSDAMAEYGAADLDRRHKRAWRGMLARPTVVRVAQRLTDAAPALTRTLHNALLDGFAARVAEALNAAPPSLVVANHGWLATAFTRARTRFGLKSRVVIFATEPFDASALWSTPRAEAVLAPSAAARSDLVDLGVPAARVAVAGYPVARRFLEAPSRAEARAALGSADAFTCLLSLGAEGVVDDAAVAAAVAIAEQGSQVIAVCGRNEALRSRLVAAHASSRAARERLQVHGFAENMEVLLAASDLVVGKAGPASTMEALAVGRPVLAASYAGLNEQKVVAFLRAYGLGDHVPGFDRLPSAVAAWREDGARRAQAERAVEAFDFGGMLEGLGRYLTAAAAGAAASPPSAPHGSHPGSHAEADPALTALLRPGLMAEVTRERLAGGPGSDAGHRHGARAGGAGDEAKTP